MTSRLGTSIAFTIGGDRIGQAAAVADHLLADEHIDVRPQAAALVADVEADARREGLQGSHHVGHGAAKDEEMKEKRRSMIAR